MSLLLKCTACQGTGMWRAPRNKLVYHCRICEGTGEAFYEAPRYYTAKSHRPKVSTGRPSPSATILRAVSLVKAGLASSKRWILRR